MSRLANLRAEKATILASIEWGFAMSSDPAIRNHPRSQRLRERMEGIEHQIAELTRYHGEEMQ